MGNEEIKESENVEFINEIKEILLSSRNRLISLYKKENLTKEEESANQYDEVRILSTYVAIIDSLSYQNAEQMPAGSVAEIKKSIAEHLKLTQSLRNHKVLENVLKGNPTNNEILKTNSEIVTEEQKNLANYHLSMYEAAVQMTTIINYEEMQEIIDCIQVILKDVNEVVIDTINAKEIKTKKQNILALLRK